MILNFGKGKTEALVSFVGPDSKSSRVQLLVVDKSARSFRVNSLEHSISFVSSYKHLGSMSSISNNIGAEVCLRNGIMLSESERLRQKVLKPSNIALSRKINILKAYIFSKGTHNCGTWETLSMHLFRKFHHTIMSCYRDITREKCFDNMFSDDEVIYKYELTCPMTILRSARLQLFLRIISKAPSFVLNLILDLASIKVGWPTALLADLKWLCLSEFYSKASYTFLNDACPTTCSDMSVHQWSMYFSVSVKKHDRRIKSWCVTPAANIVANWAVNPAFRAINDLFCDSCDAVFQSSQQLMLHKFKKHGVKHPIRRYVDSTHCIICMKEFWSRERIMNHLKYKSAVCRLQLCTSPPCLSEEQAQVLDDAEKQSNISNSRLGRRRHHAVLPCVQLYGPLVPSLIFGCDGPTHHPLGAGRSYATICNI